MDKYTLFMIEFPLKWIALFKVRVQLMKIKTIQSNTPYMNVPKMD